MDAKAKRGILKPIHFFSQIFGETTKEPEMQIGLPTDIKHVAHIGCEGPNANNPTWMKDYHSAPVNPTYEEKGSPAQTWGSQGVEDSSAAGDESAHSRPRHTRRHKSDETSKKTDGSGETAEEIKKHRKGRKKAESTGGAQDMPLMPKQSHHRRKKSKDIKSKAPKANEKRAGADDD